MYIESIGSPLNSKKTYNPMNQRSIAFLRKFNNPIKFVGPSKDASDAGAVAEISKNLASDINADGVDSSSHEYVKDVVKQSDISSFKSVFVYATLVLKDMLIYKRRFSDKFIIKKFLILDFDGTKRRIHGGNYRITMYVSVEENLKMYYVKGWYPFEYVIRIIEEGCNLTRGCYKLSYKHFNTSVGEVLIETDQLARCSQVFQEVCLCHVSGFEEDTS